MIRAEPSVTFNVLDCGAAVNISRFRGESGVEEYHLMVRPTRSEGIEDQLGRVVGAYQSALASIGLDRGTCVLRRFFCQAAVLEAFGFASLDDMDEPCAVSWVCQPPAPPARAALWAYHVSDSSGALDKIKEGASLLLRRGQLAHLWTTGVTCTDRETSYGQTEGILESYEGCLKAHGLCLAHHVVRTWFFVRNMDANYQGLVAARREVFARRGLTPDTHFIASTGVGGASADAAAIVSMDAYAISGLRGDQIQFLSAPDHLSPTYIYGVTFERGVSVAYRDRKHVIISGTASIDSAGRIVHVGDLLRQLDHSIENVEALLEQAGATLNDACMFIVYVRNASDLDVVRRVMRERSGAAPFQVVMAPVCRPGWLVEIECQAIVPSSNPTLPDF
jgi:enamine deaminase RidA (YjgF/YER057c/UK114 family)